MDAAARRDRHLPSHVLTFRSAAGKGHWVVKARFFCPLLPDSVPTAQHLDFMINLRNFHRSQPGQFMPG